ncbi:MAG: hypothetical protein K2Q20_10340, partial [Phycisphaerales bacterium]|nr:hypothetical protein [Phycisphaerales bacterium]
MNLTQLLDHWQITENPFRGEEARQDPVFLRLEAASQAGLNGNARAAELDADRAPAPGVTAHSEFEKICADIARPSSAIVFGEKGSGKTAIRLQLADRVAAFNKASPAARCLWIGYDDLNPVLGRFVDRGGGARVDKKTTVGDVLAKLRLVDHIDAVLTLAVPAIVDALLRDRPAPSGSPPPAPVELDAEPRKLVKKMERSVRMDLLVLQSVYDRPEQAAGAEDRTRRLRRLLRQLQPPSFFVWTVLALTGWVLPAGVAYHAYTTNQLQLNPGNNMLWLFAGALAVYLLVLFKRSIFDRLRYIALGHRVRKQVRVSLRSDASYGRSIRQLPTALVDAAVLPMSNADDVRYAMLERLRRVLARLGYAGVMLVIDRVDEPTLVAGDPERMKSVVWPLLDNKFLQQPGLGVKMLLPMELRHALFRESSQFFEKARLDKQSMIERLGWTGSMLYDLCTARLRACRRPGAGGGDAISLIDLFDQDVTKSDLIDALDQMH